jgi:hypothetical protein
LIWKDDPRPSSYRSGSRFGNDSKLFLIRHMHLLSEGFSPPYNFSLWLWIIWELSQIKVASMSQNALDDWIASLLSTRSNREIARLVQVGQDRVRVLRAAQADHRRILR